MADEGSITKWIAELRSGRSIAAGRLWERYYERLVRLARQKLRDAPRRMADEEDVVISAFDSFCRGAQEGRFPKLEDRDDLWQVLVMLTARKASNQLKHDRRHKRGGGQVRGESVFQASADEQAGLDQIVGSEPTPEFAHQVSEECRRMLDLLDDETLRHVALAKMEGYLNEEIAQRLGVKLRTVERKLRVIRELWSEP
jgi:RNA polymerase sigma factor (sigma-70 family)